MTVTVHDLMVHRIGADPNQTSFSGADYERAGLPMLGGCAGCEATIAGYNSYPSADGYLRCADCIGDTGWDTVEDANRDIFLDEDGLTRRQRQLREAANQRALGRAEDAYERLITAIRESLIEKGLPGYHAKTAHVVTQILWDNPFALGR
jgi:hypothetical protein